MSWRKATNESDVREFVYLDETSVESLLASVDGEILVQRTNTASKSTEAGIAGKFRAKSPFGHASFAPTLKQSRGSEVQELHKSVAQSAFARFRSKNLTKFAIRPLPAKGLGRRVRRRLKDLDPKAIRNCGQGIPLSDLERGDLLEFETDLVAADIFKARTAISAVTDVVDAYPSFLEVDLRESLKLARPLTALIDSLTGASIPVVGESPSIQLAEIGGVRWLVNSSLHAATGAKPQVALEGVALQQWFWGDVGRILFRPARYRMLCRVVNPVLTDTASGSYAGSILRTVSDDLADTVDGLGTMFLGALRSGHRIATEAVTATPGLDPALWAYVREATRLAGSEPTQLACEAIQMFEGVTLRQLSIEQQSLIFSKVDETLALSSSTVDFDARAHLRDRIRTERGLWPWSPAEGTSDANDDSTVSGPDGYLEVAIVAVCW